MRPLWRVYRYSPPCQRCLLHLLFSAPKTDEKAVDVARIYNLVKDCDGSFEAKKNIVHAIIASIDYERVDKTHKNGIYDIKFSIHFI